MTLDRSTMLRHRVNEQGLRRTEKRVTVVDFGVQYTGKFVLPQVFAARSEEIPYRTDDLALLWSYRGAPHLHKRTDLPVLAKALLVDSEAQARTVLSWSKPHVQRTGVTALDAIHRAVDAAVDIVTEPMSKGAVSAAITTKMPAGLTYACRSCRSTHVYDQLMRVAMLSAGIELDPEAPKTVLRPIPGWRRPEHSDRGSAIRGYLRFLGPATKAHIADFLGAGVAALNEQWPADLEESTVDGSTYYSVGELTTTDTSDVVRLLPAWDPYLQARDRSRVVPDKSLHQHLWRILGNPGAVLADTEIVATWRARLAGKKLRVSVEPFAPLDPQITETIRQEAEILARLRGTDLVLDNV